jgi:PLP dependent protein
LLAVSKTVPVARIRQAVEAGQTLFGENRVQEAAEKVGALPSVGWHLVGHLQRNKAARAAELFDALESVDSLALGQRLGQLVTAGAARVSPLPVYLQVNVDADPAKTGFDPAQLEADLPTLAAIRGLRLEGLMTVGRLVAQPEEARPTFASLAALSERLRSASADLGPGLSMGMSDDFEVAVEEGATLVRIGRALFGERGG